MYNKYMTKEQLSVRVNDKVRVCGYIGYVTEVFRGCVQEYNKELGAYIDQAGKEYTDIRVHFVDSAVDYIGNQYQDGVYSNWAIINEEVDNV